MTATAQEARFESLYASFVAAVDEDTSAMTLLDFGCGKAGYVRLYRPYFARAYALDVVEHFANSYADDDVTFVHSDGSTIPLPDEGVDVIVSHSVFEHVEDVDAALGECNRVLRTGGYGYFTVSPLYYSESGGHNTLVDGERRRVRLWDHLDPDSDVYMGQDAEPYRLPEEQWHALLNKLTVSQFLAAVGRQPWDILHLERTVQPLELPPFLRDGDHPLPRVDLFVRGFRCVVRKAFTIVDDRVILPEDSR
jgi:ubiquinone/menaquinone biosynthesis C-methylase UbiE